MNDDEHLKAALHHLTQAMRTLDEKDCKEVLVIQRGLKVLQLRNSPDAKADRFLGQMGGRRA